MEGYQYYSEATLKILLSLWYFFQSQCDLCKRENKPEKLLKYIYPYSYLKKKKIKGERHAGQESQEQLTFKITGFTETPDFYS